ncbi:hypothetical protein LPJ53_001158 [Coemansia erecta]|uniref:CBM1 domain-containing protein n=1 Tax=Coemansia erecta TaxID=147472 RepID=A0A9W7Y5Y8_9FUNG|nr:hypothetical protein LPJ53_001158 [Coemansia erecta]
MRCLTVLLLGIAAAISAHPLSTYAAYLPQPTIAQLQLRDRTKLITQQTTSYAAAVTTYLTASDFPIVYSSRASSAYEDDTPLVPAYSTYASGQDAGTTAAAAATTTATAVTAATAGSLCSLGVDFAACQGTSTVLLCGSRGVWEASGTCGTGLVCRNAICDWA